MKSHGYAVYVLFIFISQLAICIGSAAEKHSNVLRNPEGVLIGYRFDRGKLATEQEIIKAYGEGCREQHKRKYELQNGKYVVEFAFQGESRWLTGVGISYARGNSSNCVIKKGIRSLKTGQGLKLGDSVAKVLKLYAHPAYRSVNGKIVYKTSSVQDYWMFYRDDIVPNDGTDLPNGIPPFSQMGIKICNGIVCEIGLTIFNWTSDGKIIVGSGKI